MGSEVSRNTNFIDNRVYTTHYPSSFAEKAEMHWKKPSRLELFSEDFYCPLIFEAEAKCNVSFPSPVSPLSLVTDSVQEDRHQKSVPQSSQENILNNEAVDENCNIIQKVAIHVQEPEDHNYTSEEQEEIDLKVENAIASDPDAALELEVTADLAEASTNTSQPHLLDAASGNSQVLMVESAVGTSQPWMIECGIQTSQDFGLKTLHEDHEQSPKRKLHSTSTATTKCDAPIVLPRLPIQTSGPEVPVKIRRIGEGLRTIYSVGSECYDFEDSNKENVSTVIYHRGYKNKGRIPTSKSKLQNPSNTIDDDEPTDENEGECHGPSNELTSSRGLALRIGLSKKSRALKPLHTKVPFGGQRHFKIPMPIVVVEDDEED